MSAGVVTRNSGIDANLHCPSDSRLLARCQRRVARTLVPLQGPAFSGIYLTRLTGYRDPKTMPKLAAASLSSSS
jgi:hypothetical protein